MQKIHGKCPSKSNCYRIITAYTKGKAHAAMKKSDALVAYENSFYLQCNEYRNKMIKGLFEIHLNVYYENQRPDLDNCLKIILDCLQTCKEIY